MTMKNKEKIEKNKKRSEKIRLLIFLGNNWSKSDLAKDLDNLHYFRDWHANRVKSNFNFKVSGFFPKGYTCCILPMLNMIVMKVAKLYILYEHFIIFIHVLLHQWIMILHDMILLAY